MLPAVALSLTGSGASLAPLASPWEGPSVVLADPRGGGLFIAAERGRAVLVLDPHRGTVRRTLSFAGAPTGLAWDQTSARLVVTVGGESDSINWCAPETGQIEVRWPAGPGVCSPVIGPEDQRLYVCLRFARAIGVHDRLTGQELRRIAVPREPINAALSPDGNCLVVAHFLPEGPANGSLVAATLTLIDTRTERIRTHLQLPNGATAVRGLAISPDGRWCAAVHTLGRFQVPTTQLEHGWMNSSALSWVDLPDAKLIGTVLLDESRHGAANPWAVTWTADGALLCVTQAGTHDLSVIDAPALQHKLAATSGGLIGDWSFLSGLRQRIPLAGNGPRAMALVGEQAYVAGFFSDTIDRVDLQRRRVTGSTRLGPTNPVDPAREGERLFNDATLSRQGWQSCASCHPDGRVDGLNWDLLNDGLGNAKNTRSLIWSHRTPPAMSTGVRASAELAVRAGMRHILFAVPNEAQAQALDAYLRALRPVRSPYRARSDLTAAIQRGRRLFEDPRVGCSVCHPAPLFTDLKAHSVGTAGGGEGPKTPLDTPTLVECWRTAPYLHDGSAPTLDDVLKQRNPQNRHGTTSHLSAQELDALAVYVLTL